MVRWVQTTERLNLGLVAVAFLEAKMDNHLKFPMLYDGIQTSVAPIYRLVDHLVNYPTTTDPQVNLEWWS